MANTDELTFFAGSDHAGAHLKNLLVKKLIALGIQVVDCGGEEQVKSDYPAVAHQVSEKVSTKKGSFGLLICGTGLGMSYAANRHFGIRGALCHTATESRLAREHNNANILILGARITGEILAEDILESFLNSKFAGGRHQIRIDLIDSIVSLVSKENLT